jgi:hypothetical protein
MARQYDQMASRGGFESDKLNKFRRKRLAAKRGVAYTSVDGFEPEDMGENSAQNLVMWRTPSEEGAVYQTDSLPGHPVFSPGQPFDFFLAAQVGCNVLFGRAHLFQKLGPLN